MFVDFFIRRPIFATVCALLIILAGAVPFPRSPSRSFPISLRRRSASAPFYNGANARAVETSVTTHSSRHINGVEGMKYMTSSSGNDGSSGINITFDITRNIDLAAVDVQNRVNQALGRMPNEVKTTGISDHESRQAISFSAQASMPNTASTTACFSATILISTCATR